MKRWSIGHWSLLLLSIIVLKLLLLYLINIKEVNNLKSLINDDTNKPGLSTDTINDVPDSSAVNVKHQHKINTLESESGINLSRISRLIISDEGKRNTPYLDTNRIVTIGIGRSLQTNGISKSELLAILPKPDLHYILESTHIRNGRIYIDNIQVANKIFSTPLDEDDMALLLADDLKNTVSDAKSIFGDIWNDIEGPRKEVILDTIYNLGLTHFKSFEKFINYVKQGDWNKASDELLLSEAARNNVLRYHRNASVIRTNDPKYFELK